MLKLVFNIIKRIIIGVLLIYTYNKMSMPLDLFIPMNVITILLVGICGIPSIIMLVLFSMFCI